MISVVTGAAGHVGINLVRALVDRGETVGSYILNSTKLKASVFLVQVAKVVRGYTKLGSVVA